MVLVGLVHNIGKLANILGCKVLPLPMKYLGLLLGTPHKSEAMWDGVNEKKERRLARWKIIYVTAPSLRLRMSLAYKNEAGQESCIIK